MTYEDPRDRRLREIAERQARAEAAKQRINEDAARRAEASGAAEIVRALSRYVPSESPKDRPEPRPAVIDRRGRLVDPGVSGFEPDDWQPEHPDPGTLAANQLSWSQMREAVERSTRDNADRR